MSIKFVDREPMQLKFYTTEKVGTRRSKTPEGFLLIEGVAIARTGELVYHDSEIPITPGPGGIIRVQRDAEEVFKPESVASANGKSVVNDHPDDDVDPSNWRYLSCGIVMNARRGEGAESDLLLADLLITDAAAIVLIEEGKRELSAGYDANYTELAPGRGRQTKIIINHVALVESGRCGSRCAIRDKATIQPRSTTMAAKKSWKDRVLDAFKARDEGELTSALTEAPMTDEASGEGGDQHIHVHLGNDGGGKTEGVTQGAVADKGTKDADEEQPAWFKAHVIENNNKFDALNKRLDEMKPAAAATVDDNTEIEGDLKEEAPAGTDDALVVKSKDSAYLEDSFQTTVAMAEIICPGIAVPTFDRAASPKASLDRICKFRRTTLDLAYAQPATRGIIDDLLNGQPMDLPKLSCGKVRDMFRSVHLAKKQLNNAAMQHNTHDNRSQQRQQEPPKKLMTAADVNKRNAEFYAANP